MLRRTFFTSAIFASVISLFSEKAKSEKTISARRYQKDDDHHKFIFIKIGNFTVKNGMRIYEFVEVDEDKSQLSYTVVPNGVHGQCGNQYECRCPGAYPLIPGTIIGILYLPERSIQVVYFLTPNPLPDYEVHRIAQTALRTPIANYDLSIDPLTE